jgi:hypothetical protein
MSDWTRSASVIEVADVLRVACVVVAAVALGYVASAAMSLWSQRKVTPPPLWLQLLGGVLLLLAGGAALTIAALFTEIGRMGTQLTWRLPVNMFGTSAVALGSMIVQVRCSGRPTAGPAAWFWRRVHRDTPQVDHGA